MAIRYTITTEGEMLTVEASGCDDNVEEVMAYGTAIVDAAVRAGCRRILTDERRLEYRLGTVETFECASFIARYAPHVARVAIVCSTEFLRIARFWETVAGNRGLTVRVFDDIAAARGWLESPSAQTYAGVEGGHVHAGDPGPDQAR